MAAKRAKKTADKANPRILIVTPEITYLPEGMGNLSGRMSAKAGGMADVSASLVGALFDLGADVHVALPHYRRMFHVDPRVLIPRPETELLCEWALSVISGLSSPCGAPRDPS